MPAGVLVHHVEIVEESGHRVEVFSEVFLDDLVVIFVKLLFLKVLDELWWILIKDFGLEF